MLPSQGERLVLVCYTPRGFSRLPAEDLRTLRELGFPIPQFTPTSHLRSLFPQADAESSLDNEGFRAFDSSSDESDADLHWEACLSHPLEAFCLASDDHDTVSVQALFLSRVVRDERLDVLEELRLSSIKDLESFQLLQGLEFELQRVEEELELSDAAAAVLACDGPVEDIARQGKAKLMSLGVCQEYCEPGELGFSGVRVRELKVVEGGEESSDLPGPDGIWH